jgi:hypothetical protein
MKDKFGNIVEVGTILKSTQAPGKWFYIECLRFIGDAGVFRWGHPAGIMISSPNFNMSQSSLLNTFWKVGEL